MKQIIYNLNENDPTRTDLHGDVLLDVINFPSIRSLYQDMAELSVQGWVILHQTDKHVTMHRPTKGISINK